MSSFRRAQIPVRPIEPRKCSVHSNTVVILSCNSCNGELVCPKCITTSHNKHDFVELQELVSRKKNSINAKMNMADEKATEVSTVLKNIADVRKSNVTLTEEVVKEIQKKKEQLQSDIDKLANTLEEKCRQKSKEKEEILFDQEKRLKDIQANISDFKEQCQTVMNAGSIWNIVEIPDEELENFFKETCDDITVPEVGRVSFEASDFQMDIANMDRGISELVVTEQKQPNNANSFSHRTALRRCVSQPEKADTLSENSESQTTEKTKSLSPKASLNFAEKEIKEFPSPTETNEPLEEPSKEIKKPSSPTEISKFPKRIIKKMTEPLPAMIPNPLQKHQTRDMSKPLPLPVATKSPKAGNAFQQGQSTDMSKSLPAKPSNINRALSEPVYEGVVTSIRQVSRFNFPSAGVYAVCPVSSDQAWIAGYISPSIHTTNLTLVNAFGQTLQVLPLDTQVKNFVLCSDGSIIASCKGGSVRRMYPGMMTKNLFATQYSQSGLCLTPDGNIVICFCDSGMMMKYSTAGALLAQLTVEQTGISHPYKIVLNPFTGGYVAIDKGMTSSVLLLNRDLKVEFIYDGITTYRPGIDHYSEIRSAQNAIFNDVCFDKMGDVIVAGIDNISGFLIKLSKDGKFLCRLQNFGRIGPYSLVSGPGGKIWVGFENGDIALFE